VAFEDDKKTLIDILAFVRNVLDELVADHVTQDKELFQSAWSSEVRPRLGELIDRIGKIPSEDDPQGRELRDRGLTGQQLGLKRARLAAVSLKGIRKKILDIINTILGSIPGADPVKEFKEFVEESIDEPTAPAAPTPSITARFS
jgi:hypothetical protein